MIDVFIVLVYHYFLLKKSKSINKYPITSHSLGYKIMIYSSTGTYTNASHFVSTLLHRVCAYVSEGEFMRIEIPGKNKKKWVVTGNSERKERKKNLLSRIYRCLDQHPVHNGSVGSMFNLCVFNAFSVSGSPYVFLYSPITSLIQRSRIFLHAPPSVCS